ncbi:SDR family NAD(P)-dependent oxidoreductase [Nocardioides jensenii]|uniref:SDR family NAD(P)-dependent oxidoreductase n=1 Tax=Nocardioides jensenii TaxID=1843 RepID=UPI000834025E|nr:SDR family NAD(P)-dependent oxidoreductase [Nocardioides jensenii]
MAANDGDFNGLVAVVTGGASGIGRAAAEELHSRGARVIVLDRDQADLGPHIHAATVDVGDSDGIEAAIDGVAARWGRLDVLVNCAGIEARGNVEDLADDEALHLLDVNVMGVLRTMRSAIPHLKRSPHGAIVNTSSVSAVRGMAGLALYSASKGAVLAMTRAIAADLLPFGVRANCVSPGTVNTPWVGRILAASSSPEAALAALESRQPMGRLVEAQEVASAIAYLASPLAPSVTGTSLDIDGGLVSLSLAPDVTRVNDPARDK